MFELGPILDVAIGMAFVFVLFALLVSTIFEAIASVFGLRARALENTIIRLIEDPQSLQVVKARIGDGLFFIFQAEKRSLKALAASDPGSDVGVVFSHVYGHPMVGGAVVRNKPSYVPASAFASALLYVLRQGRGGSLLNQIEQGVGALPKGSSLRTALETIVGEAQGDFAKIQSGVETWYDATMARLSGAYKRFTQPCNLAIGLVVAVALNVNAVDLTGKLYAEPGLRAALAGEATSYIQNNTRAEAAKVNAAEHLLLEAAPTVGWSLPPWGWGARQWGGAIFGWLITAAAGMMGGPFWFDSLQKLVNLRGTGPRPKSKSETVAANV